MCMGVCAWVGGSNEVYSHSDKSASSLPDILLKKNKDPNTSYLATSRLLKLTLSLKHSVRAGRC